MLKKSLVFFDENRMRNPTRRKFIKNFFVGGLGAVLPDFSFLKEYKDYGLIEPVKSDLTSRVLIYDKLNCVDDHFLINKYVADHLFRNALMEFAGKYQMDEAIRSLFPSFNEDLRVSIKVNTASSKMPSHPCIAHTMADCLVEAGLKPDNIIIWERTEGTLNNAGYKVSTASGSVKVIGTDTPGYGYDGSRKEKVHGVPVYLTSILTKHSDYQINLGVLKHHWFTGVATCLKNHYGSIPLFDKPLLTGFYDIIRLHWNACDPYIADLNSIIEEKVPTILHICDGLLGIYNSGPLGPPQWVNNEIMLSKDPVAVDTLSFYRVEKKRKEIGLPPLLNKAMFLRTAAQHQLGTNNPENMEIIHKSAI